MQHEMKSRYPASSDIVIRMFTDREFHTRKLEALGLLKYQVLGHQFDGADFSIKIERKVPVEVPGMVKKLVPLETTVVNEEFWNLASKTGSVKVEAQGMPLELSCVSSLADDGGECVLTHRWEIRAKLPMMGALEKFVATDMDNRAVEETRVAISLLPAYREVF
jgi:hypothetical protein